LPACGKDSPLAGTTGTNVQKPGKSTLWFLWRRSLSAENRGETGLPDTRTPALS
jgi:hypothetical protein